MLSIKCVNLCVFVRARSHYVCIDILITNNNISEYIFFSLSSLFQCKLWLTVCSIELTALHLHSVIPRIKHTKVKKIYEWNPRSNELTNSFAYRMPSAGAGWRLGIETKVANTESYRVCMCFHLFFVLLLFVNENGPLNPVVKKKDQNRYDGNANKNSSSSNSDGSMNCDILFARWQSNF